MGKERRGRAVNERTDVQGEIAAEQAYLDRLYGRLDAVREETRDRLAAALRAETPDTPHGLSERDALVRLYEERLAVLEGVDDRLCFGRLDFADGSGLYIGRIGLADARNQPLLVDWRAPAAAEFYQATAADRGEVVRRRHLTTRDRRVVAVEDEVLDLAALDDGQRRHLVGEGALMAAVQAARTGRMGDIVATIQAEQDRIIRDELRGILVVQGGPGTGKTVVSLHRTAYLLYTHRERLARSGVLLIGPSPVFLRYIERVLPSLGETGVVMSTSGNLFPSVKTALEDAPDAARIKGDVAMIDVLRRAIRLREQAPPEPLVLHVDDVALTVEPDAFAAARDHARASGLPHNAARPKFARHLYGQLLEILAQAVMPGKTLDVSARRELLEDLLAADDVRQAVWQAWPVTTPEALLAGLYGDPAQLAAAAPDLTAAERALLRRDPDDSRRWTVSDVPLLDEAAELLGVDDTAARRAARQAADRRRQDVAYAQGALRLAGGLASALVSAETLADRFGDATPQRTVAQRGREDRTWAFGHIVVDEAQDLSPMAWRLLMRRCPAKSMTLVGDMAQSSAAAGAASWAEVLAPHVQDRWRLAQLSTNYRTPAAVMALASAMLRAAGHAVQTPTSVREGEPPRWQRVAPGDLDAVLSIVRDAHAELGARRMAVIAPELGPWAVDALADALDGALPPGTVGRGVDAMDAPVALLAPRQSKGLEVDVVVLVAPADILAASPRGANDLYVALTRPTQALIVIYSGDLPGGMVPDGASASPRLRVSE